MLTNIFYIIPSIVCMVWAAIFLLRKKNSTQKIALPMLLISGLYFLLYILLFTPGIDYWYICIADVTAIPLVLGLLASVVIYVNAHMDKKWISTAKMQWLYMPAITEGSIVGLLYYLIGIDKIARYYCMCDETRRTHPEEALFDNLPEEFNTELFHLFHLFDYTILNILLAAMLAAAIMTCIIVMKKDGFRFGNVIRFLFNGKETTPTKAICAISIILMITLSPLAVVGRTYVILHPWLGICISIAIAIEIFLICHCESISYLKTFTLYDMVHVGTRIIVTGDSYEAEDDDPDSFDTDEERMKAIESITENLTSHRAVIKSSTLIKNIQNAIEEEKVWLDPELRLNNMAEQFGVNRNKISLVFNQIYGMDFKTLVAERRIEEGKRMMTEHPTATIDYIALNCGFREGGVFSHRFKEIVGMTPTEWKMKGGITGDSPEQEAG